MDDPIMLGIIAVAVLAVLGAVFLKNKQKASAGKKGKKSSSARSSRNAHADDEDDYSTESEEHENWDTVATTNVVDDTKVSVQGRGTRSPNSTYTNNSATLTKPPNRFRLILLKRLKKDPQLAGELVELWLQAKKC